MSSPSGATRLTNSAIAALAEDEVRAGAELWSRVHDPQGKRVGLGAARWYFDGDDFAFASRSARGSIRSSSSISAIG